MPHRELAHVRSAFTYRASTLRVADLGLRAARFRALALLALSAALVVDGSPWLAWFPVVLAATGVYFSMVTNGYQLSETVPRGPVARWAWRLTTSRSGQMAPDVPGTIEGLSYVPLALVGPWLMRDGSSEARLVALAAALAWIGSCVNAVFADAAFYNPDLPTNKSLARLTAFADVGRRTFLGPLASGLAAALTLPAPWEPRERLVAAGMCLALGAVQLRVRETDRILTEAAKESESRVITSRHELVEAVHELIGSPTALLRARIEGDEYLTESLRDDLFVLESGYDDVLGLETEIDRDIDWPGLLHSHVDRLRGLHQIEFELDLPDHLQRVDRAIAHQVLYNLADNAVAAGATVCRLILRHDGDLLVLTATDDGEPVDPAVWNRPHGAMRRLRSRLRRTGGGSGLELVATGNGSQKSIRASWLASTETT